MNLHDLSPQELGELLTDVAEYGAQRKLLSVAARAELIKAALRVTTIDSLGRRRGLKLADVVAFYRARAPQVEVAPEPVQDPTFDRLRAWRREVALTAKVPAFCVLPDRALREIVQRRPATIVELSKISGVGPVKLQRYGTAVLALLRGDAKFAS